METIKTTRTAAEVRQRCMRERYLGFHYNGVGIVKKSGKYEAKFGIRLHEMMAVRMKWAKMGNDPYKVLDHSAIVNSLIDDIRECYPHMGEQEFNHMCQEQTYLLTKLEHYWVMNNLPMLLGEYDIVDVEKEYTILFQPHDYLPAQLAQLLMPVEVPFRFDFTLRRKGDGLLFVGDFKTTTQASEDWNIKLDNSYQSHLYCEAAEIIYKEPIGGMFYYGMVKGRREVDKARSSPYTGYTIQYGSFLYGWQDRYGVVSSDYVKGRNRVALWDTSSEPHTVHNIANYFPTTIPWKPLNCKEVVGQMIVAENGFANSLELYEQYPVHSAERALFENVLFEKNLDNCHKYGPKNPCQFCEKCHGMLHEDEIKQIYEVRVPHHQ